VSVELTKVGLGGAMGIVAALISVIGDQPPGPTALTALYLKV
jgi:hypothetical protein